MIKEELMKRHLPTPLILEDGAPISDKAAWESNREKIKALLSFHQYGLLPPAPNSTAYNVLEEEKHYFASTGVYRKVLITAHMDQGMFLFPIHFIQPKKPGKHKTIVHISFRDNIPDKYMPCEEICDNGFAIASFCYEHITSDDGDFSDGLAGILFGKHQRGCADAGKIMLWAWAAMRVMDFLQTQEAVDLNHIAVLGHSRLGKAALVTAAFDERFAFVHANNSGCSGAAISRQKDGESIDDICRQFPFWFCENYQRYRGKAEMLPFDQHYLLSLIAPRHISVGSAAEDLWADPKSEFLCCAATSPIYSLYEKNGLIAPDRYPVENDIFHEGTIGYHMRGGSHYLSRYDWNQFMAFMTKHVGISCKSG